MTRVIIMGAKGRMGQALIGRAGQLPGIELAGALDVGDDLKGVIGGADVVVDFTSHGATTGFARICAEHGKGMVIGTTGHAEGEKKELTEISRRIPMVWTSNFSTGMNVLFWLTRRAAETLGPGYDLEIVEMHHRHKKDAPSGTAATLARILTEVRREQAAEVLRHGRQGITGERSASEIGMHAIRGGDVVGDHTVMFATQGERLELTHKASSRDTFANGALRAAEWVKGKGAGIYDMEDVLGLR
jgi:4-hydroxy-tetrahydrodipicolinate reductase